MGVIVTRGTGSAGASGSVFDANDKLAFEMEMEFKTANESYYKELYYVPAGQLRGSLIDVIIWTDDLKTTQLFAKDLFYNSSKDLSRTLLTRDSDGAQLLKIFEYTDGDLTSITVSAG
jgi:hypothetical protein